MLYNEGQVVHKGVWRCCLMLLMSFLLALVANGSVQDKQATKRSQNQQLPSEARLEFEQRLSALGYWTGAIDGIIDPASIQALIAFQKVEGRRRTGRFTSEELQALRNATKPLPRVSGSPHIEVDLGRQVLFIVDDAGSVTRILPVCTGNEKLYVDQGQTHRAHTPSGKFRVLRKIAGWRRSSLGLLYYPNYIHEGIAIHGSPSMRVYPASHGCIRIPMFASKRLSKLMPLGTEVIVYDSERVTTSVGR